MWLIDLSNNFLSAVSVGWNSVLQWLNMTLSDALNSVSLLPIVGDVLESILKTITININGESVAIMDITVLQLMFGVGVPIFLGFTFIKWLLNLIT